MSDLTDKQESFLRDAETLRAKYRLVFGEGVGREVLADILTRKLRFGNYLSEALGDIALHNAAIEILGMMGVIGRDRGLDVINGLLTIAPDAGQGGPSTP